MTGWVWFAFVLGAGIGAPLRFVIDGAVGSAVGGDDDSWSRGTLIVNAVGSLVLGIVTALTIGDQVSGDVAVVVGTGFCGALTTYSTFAVQTVRLIDAGAIDAALRNIAYNTAVSIGLAAFGYAATLGVT